MGAALTLGTVGGGVLGRLPAAWAQPAGDASSALVESARRAHDLGHLDEAISAFGQAYQISGDPRLLFEMAEAQREAGHDAEALRSFKTYLRRDPAGTYRTSAEKEVRELEQQLKSKGGATAPAVGPAPGPATSPATSPVTSPATRKSGAAAEAPGENSAETEVQARKAAAVPVGAPGGSPAGAHGTRTVLTAPPPAPSVPAPAQPTAPPALSSIPVRSSPTVATPAAAPVVPAKPAAPAPRVVPLPLAVAPGPTAAAASAPSAGVDLTRPANAGPSESARTSLPTWVPWVLGATTLALATGTVISGLSASSRFDELKNSCGATGCPSSEIDDVRSRASRTNVLLALTGVAAVGTGVAVYFAVDSAGASGQWRF